MTRSPQIGSIAPTTPVRTEIRFRLRRTSQATVRNLLLERRGWNVGRIWRRKSWSRTVRCLKPCRTRGAGPALAGSIFFTSLFLLEQVNERIFAAVFELSGIEMTRLGVDDGEIEYLLR